MKTNSRLSALELESLSSKDVDGLSREDFLRLLAQLEYAGGGYFRVSNAYVPMGTSRTIIHGGHFLELVKGALKERFNS